MGSGIKLNSSIWYHMWVMYVCIFFFFHFSKVYSFSFYYVCFLSWWDLYLYLIIPIKLKCWILIWEHPSTQLSSNFSIILFCNILSPNSYDRILKNDQIECVEGRYFNAKWIILTTSWWYLKLYRDVCHMKHIVRKVQMYDIKVEIGSGCDPNKLAYLLQMEHIP